MVKIIITKKANKMKKIILKVLVIGVILSSCSNKETKTTIKTISKVETNKIEKVLQEYMEAWAEHNVTKIGNFFADEVQWYDLPSDGITKGKSKVTKAITDAFMGYVPNMYWVKSGDTFISGNTITYEWTYGGTFNGSWGDLAIKDKRFSIRGISTTTINDEGKITAQKDYYDLYGFQKQLGVIE